MYKFHYNKKNYVTSIWQIGNIKIYHRAIKKKINIELSKKILTTL